MYQDLTKQLYIMMVTVKPQGEAPINEDVKHKFKNIYSGIFQS